MKKCTRCGRLLPLSQFHRDKISEDGHYYVCKECRRKYYTDGRSAPAATLKRTPPTDTPPQQT